MSRAVAPMGRIALMAHRRAIATAMLAPRAAAPAAHRAAASPLIRAPLLALPVRARCLCSSSEAAKELSPKISQLVDDISSLTLLEASELSEALKDKLGVSGAMMMPAMGAMPAAAAPAAAAAAPAEEEVKAEQTSFTVKLEGFDAASKIKVIKEVRAITGLGLKEAKDLVENSPKELKADIKKEEADKLKEKLEAVGAKVAIE